MEELKLYNSLTRQKEVIEPITKGEVKVYICGPTVYDYVTIGNWRTYTLGDLVVRMLTKLGYEVRYLMNITDVGHLSGDNEGDADAGIDRMEKGASREGKSAWDIAEYYTQDFLKGFELLNLFHPFKFVKATEHIDEQIGLVQRIEEYGFVYQIADGIYFDVQAFEAAGNTYGQLSTLDEIKVGARVSLVEGKKDPRDFALWKFSPAGEKRQMEWDSPWGKGFPGWHIECSAMSMKYLGEQFDIHVGGEDLRSTHHPNEIAQSEAATGKKPFVKYWLHGAFLQVDGGRMGKSLGNAYTLSDVENRGLSIMALRYFYLTGHYRQPLNFTWEGLEAAQKALDKLYQKSKGFGFYKEVMDNESVSPKVKDQLSLFYWALTDDLNFPKALAALHEGMSLASEDEGLYVLAEVDDVLGLRFQEIGKKLWESDQEGQIKMNELLKKREEHRQNKEWDKADEVRKQIENSGYEIEDTSDGAKVRRR